MARHAQSNEPVTVLETYDPALLAVAKSLLEEAGIPFFAKGEGLHALFGPNRVIGPVEIQVAADDAAEAHSVLIDLTRDLDNRQ